jgi:hypothetical protein
MDIRPDAVGLVFVERRVTAMALNNYFQHRRSQNALLRNANPEPREVTATSTTTGSQGGDTSSTQSPKQAGAFDQFADASDGDGDDEEMDCDTNTFPETATHGVEDQFMDVDEGADQFDDAEDDPSFSVAGVPMFRTTASVDDPSSRTILVRIPPPKVTVPVQRPFQIPASTMECIEAVFWFSQRSSSRSEQEA